jgi:hypothetical protein
MTWTNREGGRNGLATFARAPRRVGGSPIGPGDMVRERDGRHVGRVAAIAFPFAIVQWLDSGWRSRLPIDEMEGA